MHLLTLDIIVNKCGGVEYRSKFRVRRSKVLNASTWLKQNNRWCWDVTINTPNMELFPKDGCIDELLVNIPDDSSDDNQEQQKYEPEPQELEELTD